ncbi:MAG: AMP-binding protein [Myxococcales bacterium]|nr:AMP-binding protein [Myxococcales bacterium]
MSFIDTIFESLRAAGDRPALVEIHGKERKTAAASELLGLAAHVRGFLKAAGVKPGDRVALFAPNSIRWVACDLGILAEGGIVVPLYARQDPKELAVMTRDCAPVLLIAATQELADAIAEAWPEHGQIALFDEVFAAEPLAAPLHDRGADDPVTLIYTSGTSGEPKGVITTRANVDYMIPQTAASLGEITGSRGAPDKVFHYLPFCFAGSRIMLWTQLHRGNPLMMSSDLTNLVQEMGTADPHYYLNVPALLERVKTGVYNKLRERGGFVFTIYAKGVAGARAIIDGKAGLGDRLFAALAGKLVFPKIKAQIGPSLEFLICGSAPLSEDTQRWFEIIGVPVYQVYGLTETTAIVTMDKPGQAVPGRVGHALPGLELRLSDEGELLIRGPNIFAGYWNKAEATAETLQSGWMHTGDQAEVDAQGNYKIIGRVKNILVPESGHNIAPEPIEQKLLEHLPGAEQAVLIGHARPYLTAIVTGKVDAAAIQAAIDRVNAEVPHYRKIRKYLHVPEPLTIESGLLTANQKLRRRVIEKHFLAELDRLYASS